MTEKPKFVQRFRIVIVEELGKEYSICEIYYRHNKWAVIEQKEKLVVKFFTPNSVEDWEFPLEEAIDALQKARKIFG